jgi:hypothetical protein
LDEKNLKITICPTILKAERLSTTKYTETSTTKKASTWNLWTPPTFFVQCKWILAAIFRFAGRTFSYRKLGNPLENQSGGQDEFSDYFYYISFSAAVFNPRAKWEKIS